MALLQACAAWGRDEGIDIAAVTVDHGLRPEAPDEAALVAQTCAALNVTHTVLQWQWDGQGNLQEAARNARRRLIADWALVEGLDAVAFGHTQDDQAETVLMNLARGSGVDGLCGMSAETYAEDIRWIRPLLGISREDLRTGLEALGAKWVEDPSNEDDRFTRVRARKLLTSLEDLGLSSDRLVNMAGRMRDAREVLTLRAYELGSEVTWDEGDLLVPLRAFRAAPRDTRHRALAALLQTISGSPHRPRFSALTDLSDDLIYRSKGGTLHGVRVTVESRSPAEPELDILAQVQAAVDPASALRRKPDSGPPPRIRLTREHAAIADVTARPGDVWDGRWCLDASDRGLVVRALGARADGPLPETRPNALPRTSLMSTPALWDGSELVAAPLAGLPGPPELGATCRHLAKRKDPLAALRDG